MSEKCQICSAEYGHSPACAAIQASRLIASTQQTADLHLHCKGARARRSMVFFRGTDRVRQIFGDHAQLQTLRALWLSGANFSEVMTKAQAMGIEL